MRFSQAYIPTLKESPADAEVISHKLLLRAGMARKLASGLYSYLPLGLRVINKIAAIVREEMNAAGFQELLLPMVQPGDLWQESGRWTHYGKELLRFKDRNGRDYCLGPTHEEVITDLMRTEIHSYKQLPVRIYQIQTKFRDEIRPRFGLLRGREFVMKDAYSFDADLASAEESYKLMYDAYMRIFSRLGLKFRSVEADTGSIGGKFSHEFMILADTGEDTIAFCENCNFASNVERAEVKLDEPAQSVTPPDIKEVHTPNAHTVDEVTKLLNVPPNKIIKTLIFIADEQPVAVLIRGDRELNEIKLKQLLHAETLEFATPEKVVEVTKAPVGFAGPVKLDIPVYADNELKNDSGYITGANEKDKHLKNVDLQRDVKINKWADLRVITSDDPCPRCGGKISLAKGIEAGHVFMLGEKYSKPMQATFLDEKGQENNIIQGCYGIGISRLAAAAIEQWHDEHGIIFPPAISPFDCMLLNLDPSNPDVNEACSKIIKDLEELNLDVLEDDRNERPGVKFNDADLLGFPAQIILGAKGLKRGTIECKDRRTNEKAELPLNDFKEKFVKWYQTMLAGWRLNECNA